MSRGSVQPFYRHTGEGGAGSEQTGGGAAGKRPRQGRVVTGAVAKPTKLIRLKCTNHHP
jgi:hypothetical protein